MAGRFDAFEEWASQPFQPSYLDENGATTDVSLRTTVALEYIAAQLGEICRKMDYVGAARGVTKEDFEVLAKLIKKI